jgi:acetyl-CoA synthetase
VAGTSVKRVIVFRRAGNEFTSRKAATFGGIASSNTWMPIARRCRSTREHPLYILYTSGSTGKPKGHSAHDRRVSVGIYSTMKYVFDLREEDVYWCTADVGWVTGHSYVVYGPLANGATTLMYEGAPNWPEPDRFWRIIEEYGSTFSTPRRPRSARSSAGATMGEEARSLVAAPARLRGRADQSGGVDVVSRRRSAAGVVPIVDTWWQTETGAIMITPLPGAIPTKPGSATLPFFGVDAAIVDESGKEVGRTSAAN